MIVIKTVIKTFLSYFTSIFFNRYYYLARIEDLEQELSSTKQDLKLVSHDYIELREAAMGVCVVLRNGNK